MIKFKVR